jgi:GTP:adenosylcobinamide-phosphate guanylyltransferase
MPAEMRETDGFDAIVMAGDRGAYKPVYAENKAFLKIEGVPVLLHVLVSLDRSRRVSRVFIVGPGPRISQALDTYGARLGLRKEFVVVDQARTVLENAQKAFAATLPEEARGESPEAERMRARFEDKAVLVLGSDIPLVTPAELDEFVEVCDLSRYDYILGMTGEKALESFYPQPGRPGSGIRFAYFCFRNSRERQNNLHMIRVLRVFNRQLIQKMYQFRYQQRWKNILQLGRELLREPEVTPRVVFKFVLLHLCRLLDRRAWRPLEKLQFFLRRFLVKEVMQADLSRILKSRFGSAATSFGGAALDVDNERDFQIIKNRYRDWMDYQESLAGLRKPDVPRKTASSLEPEKCI